MPIRIPADLPAAKTLREENIFVMEKERALRQDIRPLRILILNLMPTKIATETQLARLLGNTALQIDMELMAVSGRTPKNTPHEHMIAFYQTFDEVRTNFYDGFIITGAPVEEMPFEEVDYWEEAHCGRQSWKSGNGCHACDCCGALCGENGGKLFEGGGCRCD